MQIESIKNKKKTIDVLTFGTNNCNREEKHKDLNLNHKVRDKPNQVMEEKGKM